MIKKIKSVIASLIFCFLFVECGCFFRYILIDDADSFTRITFHEMYEQDNIDVLFVGSSHCYRAFVPEILDDELGMNTFNAGTSSQELDGSYMVIQEAARYNDIKHIYLELYYYMALQNEYKDRTAVTQTYIISDYLKPSLNKFQYLLNASASEHYFNSFVLARRNWSKFFDADYVQSLIQKKQSDDYKNYEYTYANAVWDTEWYVGKGYVANSEIIENWNYFSESGWSNINLKEVSDDWIDTLKDIIAFCDENGISLTLISTPMPNFLLAGVENYDDYVELVKDIIVDTNVDYYDFNLCREEYFPNTSSLFKDTNHVNCYGAEIFSHLLAELANGEISESELFYGSFEEKIINLEPTVFGISYYDKQKDNGEIIRDCKIVSTCDGNLEYEIILTPNNGNSYTLQEFSCNRFFVLDPGEQGVCTIIYRLSDSPDKVETIDISY